MRRLASTIRVKLSDSIRWGAITNRSAHRLHLQRRQIYDGEESKQQLALARVRRSQRSRHHLRDYWQRLGGYGEEAFTYSGGKFSYILYPGAKSTAARAIANSGKVAGVYYDTSGKGHGFTYLSGKFTAINAPGAKSTYVEGISYKTGTLSGYYVPTSGTPSGFVYSNSVFTNVNYPGGKDTIVTSINDSGDLAGVFANSKGLPEGFSAKP